MCIEKHTKMSSSTKLVDGRSIASNYSDYLFTCKIGNGLYFKRLINEINIDHVKIDLMISREGIKFFEYDKDQNTSLQDAVETYHRASYFFAPKETLLDFDFNPRLFHTNETHKTFRINTPSFKKALDGAAREFVLEITITSPTTMKVRKLKKLKRDSSVLTDKIDIIPVLHDDELFPDGVIPHTVHEADNFIPICKETSSKFSTSCGGVAKSKTSNKVRFEYSDTGARLVMSGPEGQSNTRETDIGSFNEDKVNVDKYYILKSDIKLMSKLAGLNKEGEVILYRPYADELKVETLVDGMGRGTATYIIFIKCEEYDQ